MRKAKVKFVNMKQERLTVKEHRHKFIQLSRYALEMVLNMRSKMRKLVFGLGKHVKRECKANLLISDMDICRLMVYAQQVEDKRKYREKHQHKKAKSSRHEPSQQKQGNVNRPFFQKMSSDYAPSSAIHLCSIISMIKGCRVIIISEYRVPDLKEMWPEVLRESQLMLTVVSST